MILKSDPTDLWEEDVRLAHPTSRKPISNAASALALRTIIVSGASSRRYNLKVQWALVVLVGLLWHVRHTIPQLTVEFLLLYHSLMR